MAPKAAKAIFVDVEPDTPEEDSAVEEPPQPEPTGKAAKAKSTPEQRAAHLAAARVKALEAIRAKSALKKSETELMKTQKKELQELRKKEIDAVLEKKRKDVEIMSAAAKPAEAAPHDFKMTPEMKLFLKAKAQKYVSQALASHAPPTPAPTPAASPASDIKIMARGRVQQYLTEETLSQAMSQIFPSGRYV